MDDFFDDAFFAAADEERFVFLRVEPLTFTPPRITRLHFMDETFKQNLINKLNLINVPNVNDRVKFNKMYNNLLKKM